MNESISTFYARQALIDLLFLLAMVDIDAYEVLDHIDYLVYKFSPYGGHRV